MIQKEMYFGLTTKRHAVVSSSPIMGSTAKVKVKTDLSSTEGWEEVDVDEALQTSISTETSFN